MGLRWTVFLLAVWVAGGTPAWVFIFTGTGPSWAMWPLMGLGGLDLGLLAAIWFRDRLRQHRED